jgi:hypothetical protein
MAGSKRSGVRIPVGPQPHCTRLEGWMVGDTTDAVEIAVFADATGIAPPDEHLRAMEVLRGHVDAREPKDKREGPLAETLWSLGLFVAVAAIIVLLSVIGPGH